MSFQRSLFFILLLSSCTRSVKEDEHFLRNLMQTQPAKFQSVLDLQDSLEVQIIYTKINRDANNRPGFKSFYFNVDSTHYFYPASTVKLPLVLLAFEKLNELGVKGLTKFIPAFQDSMVAGQRSVRKDTTSENGLPSIAHYVKKILIVSDNDAANCLYEFMGQRAIHERLPAKGYNMRILHRFDRLLPPDQNRYTEAVRFVRNDTVIYSQPMLINTDSILPLRRVLKGTHHMVNNKAMPGPFDFTYKNFYPLQEYKAIGFPFMRDLGQLIYGYELNRQKEHMPDLRQFRITYDH